MHDYQIALDVEERSDGAFELQHGTLNPILHGLEDEGLIEGTWSEEGRRRRPPHGSVRLLCGQMAASVT